MHTELTIRPNPVVEFETIGSAVALSGGVAIVGAAFDGGPPGRAYIFSVDGSGVTQQAMLTPSGSSGFDNFGAAVAIDGNTAVVAAPGDYQVYVFSFDGATWTERPPSFRATRPTRSVSGTP